MQRLLTTPKFIIIGIWLTLFGCATLQEVDTPAERLLVATGIYNTARDGLKTAVRTGVISREDARDKIEPARKAARDALDAAILAVQSGDPDAQLYLTLAISAVNSLNAFYLENQ